MQCPHCGHLLIIATDGTPIDLEELRTPRYPSDPYAIMNNIDAFVQIYGHLLKEKDTKNDKT